MLQHPDILKRIVAELDDKLPESVGVAYPVNGLEQKLPYTMACIQENFRINAVFTMPLTRQINAKTGVNIDGHLIPAGVSGSC